MSTARPPSRELPTHRLATADERGRRIYLYPSDARGRFRWRRTLVHYALIVIFLGLPWVKIGGHQAVLLNILERRFAILGITFWAHDAPMLVFVFGGAALSLGLVTAIWGRVWCGWTCPQTVFVDTVFRAIERAIEGDHMARKALDDSAWTYEKWQKKIIKWALFTLITLVITHSFLAYFVGTQGLAEMMRHTPTQSPIAFSIMFAITALILFDFGWFREQFCTVLCPYGRFQSILMDEHSLIIAYDEKRGEPRKDSEAAASKTTGDCVNCYRCVQVCPTGIDIRRGTQLECIACTACIDACDDVMTRLHKPQGLIRYDSAAGLQGKKTQKIRQRTLAYFALIATTFIGLATTLASRGPVQAAFVRAADTPYQEVRSADGANEIINRFRVDLGNQSFEPLSVHLKASPTDIMIVTAQPRTHIAAGQSARQEFFVKFPKALLKYGKTVVRFSVVGENEEVLATEEVTLVGPYQ